MIWICFMYCICSNLGDMLLSITIFIEIWPMIMLANKLPNPPFCLHSYSLCSFLAAYFYCKSILIIQIMFKGRQLWCTNLPDRSFQGYFIVPKQIVKSLIWSLKSWTIWPLTTASPSFFSTSPLLTVSCPLQFLSDNRQISLWIASHHMDMLSPC